jgi:ABC-type sulfate/molybdate transport systems ATPase subunit
MGLYGRIGWCRPVTRKYRRIALDALDRVGIADLANRQISQLSGGQQQRVFLARALAQDARIYLLDEPLAGVDATTERVIIDVLRELRERGKTLVVVHHDLETLREYFDWIVMLNVRLIASGPVESTFTTETFQATYGGRLAALAGLVEIGAVAVGRGSGCRESSTTCCSTTPCAMSRSARRCSASSAACWEPSPCCGGRDWSAMLLRTRRCPASAWPSCSLAHAPRRC